MPPLETRFSMLNLRIGIAVFCAKCWVVCVRAFHNDQKIKSKYLTRVRQHREADKLVQGTAWYNGEGCAVGCTLEAYDHTQYPVELGIPEVLAHVEDKLFELQTPNDAQRWPELFLQSIRVGADLSLVWPKFAVWLLREVVPSKHGEVVAKLYERIIAGEDVDRQEIRNVFCAAYGAVSDYVSNCDESIDANTAYAAAFCIDAVEIAHYGGYAVDSAYLVVAASYAIETSEYVIKMRNKLIELLREA